MGEEVLREGVRGSFREDGGVRGDRDREEDRIGSGVQDRGAPDSENPVYGPSGNLPAPGATSTRSRTSSDPKLSSRRAVTPPRPTGLRQGQRSSSTRDPRLVPVEFSGTDVRLFRRPRCPRLCRTRTERGSFNNNSWMTHGRQTSCVPTVPLSTSGGLRTVDIR